jgi:alpha-beta hydrolase superfamily lysophospholipase
MDLSHLHPLPRLTSKTLCGSRNIDENYFKWYGLDVDVPHHFGAVSVTSHTQSWMIATHVFLPEQAKGTVVVIHGLFDHTGLYSHVIHAALKENYAVLAFDLPGHGMSSGDRASIGSFDDYTYVLSEIMQEFKDVLPKSWHGVGQSTGGRILMDFLFKESNRDVFQTRALLAPLVRPYRWSMLQYVFHVLKHVLKRTKREFPKNSSDLAFINFVKNSDSLQARYLDVRWLRAMHESYIKFLSTAPVEDQPLLVIQGTNDRTIDAPYNIKVILEKFKGSRVSYIPNAAHHLVNETVDHLKVIEKSLVDLWSQV